MRFLMTRSTIELHIEKMVGCSISFTAAAVFFLSSFDESNALLLAMKSRIGTICALIFLVLSFKGFWTWKPDEEKSKATAPSVQVSILQLPLVAAIALCVAILSIWSF